MRDESAAFDAAVRREIYEAVIARGSVPSAGELAAAIGGSEPTVRESLERLAAGHVLVLQPESREILMANPFSAVPTPFAVACGGRRYFGNCIWDALGIPGMLGSDARIATSCPCCGEAMAVEVADGALAAAAGVVHFAVPARRWWDDIAFT